VFDAHTHAVSPDAGRFPRHRPDFPAAWLEHDPPSAGVLEAELVRAEVTGALLVQPQGAYGFDNRYVVEAAAGSPRLAAVTSIDVTEPDRAAQVHLMADAGAVGVRLFSIPTPAVAWLDDPTTFDAWAACRDRGLVVSICCLPAEVPQVLRVATHFVDVAVVLDHCAFVDLAAGSGPLDELADLDNLHLKVTGHMLHELADRGLEPDRVVADLAGLVGADRMLWGSDWPQTGLTYPASAALGRQAAARLDAGAAASFLGDTATGLYRQSMV